MSLLTDRVSNKVTFRYFKDNVLWYATSDDWEFPVPVSDTVNEQGDGPRFNAEDKGIYFMRWIRRQIAVDTTPQEPECLNENL